MQGYDYDSPGVYFVTLCTADRECLFGVVDEEQVLLSPVGEIVEAELRRSTDIRSEVCLDAFVVMPNHLHALVVLDADARFSNEEVSGARRAPLRVTPRSLGALIGGFKAAVTRRVREEHGWQGDVWQRNYHERVVRSETEWDALRDYIRLNPLHWADDPVKPTT